MHRTLPLQKGGRMVSTRNGQRRILKRLVPVVEYIEKAVETGVYRSNDEIHAAMMAVRRGDLMSREPQVAVERFRKDIIRGTSVQDYPAEYHILKMHPPIPKPPRIPKKAERRMEAAQKKHPYENLVVKFMQREVKPKASKENYYKNLLGIQPPVETYAMGQKSAAISKAYAYAVKQYEIMRTQDVSETEALKIVDQLLAEENRQEGHTSRANTETMQEWKKTSENANKKESDSDAIPANLPSILHDRPRVVEGMLQWSRMLQKSGIPYSQWTVGASTALDHWIARTILDLSEATWQALLEGADPNLLSRGQDIIAVRETLFPETRLDVDADALLEQQEEEERKRDERAAMMFDRPSPPPPPVPERPRERTVDELLRSLRGLDREDDKRDPKWSFGDKLASSQEDKQPDKPKPDGPKDEIQVLTDELQEWRSRNVRSPFEKWPRSEQQRFWTWLDTKYLSLLASEVDRPLIDREETRIALLSSPPQTEEESENFWSSVQDETKADIFLQNLLQKGPPEGLSETERAFWSMSYEDQLEKLVNLGTLRPLMDDYMSESQRVDFMRRYGDYFLDGVELDHLVPDAQGPISGMDLGAEAIRAWGIQRDDRFRLVKLPYKAGLTGNVDEDGSGEGQTGSDLALERSRALFRSWNELKASRARYEEQMFVQGDLGLSYDSKTANEMEKERNEKLKHEDDPVIETKKKK